MKEIILHYTVMKRYEVPDYCPSNKHQAQRFLDNHPENEFLTSEKTDGFEIVEISDLKPDDPVSFLLEIIRQWKKNPTETELTYITEDFFDHVMCEYNLQFHISDKLSEKALTETSFATCPDENMGVYLHIEKRPNGTDTPIFVASLCTAQKYIDFIQ
jgi:hypothetical protein